MAADVRTEREKLVEAARRTTWQCSFLGPVCEERCPGQPAMWCAECLLTNLTAADLLSEEGEPVGYEHGIRQPGGNVLWLDLGKGPAGRGYLGDGESIVRRALYPGPVQEATDHYG